MCWSSKLQATRTPAEDTNRDESVLGSLMQAERLPVFACRPGISFVESCLWMATSEANQVPEPLSHSLERPVNSSNLTRALPSLLAGT